MIYNWIGEEPDDLPRDVTAMAVGVGTALFGYGLPVGAGVIAALLQGFEAMLPRQTQSRSVLGRTIVELMAVTPYEYIVDGVVDASVALLAQAAVLRHLQGTQPGGPPLAQTRAQIDDRDALVG